MTKPETDVPAGWSRSDEFSQRDSLAPYRDQIWRSMGCATEVLLTPFTINNLIQGRILVGVVLLVIQLIILVDTYFAWHGKSFPVPRAFLLLPFMLGVSVAILEQGVPGVLWSYPVVVFCYFVLTRRVAIICSLLVVTHVFGMTYFILGHALALRLLATLLLTIIMINVVLNVIYTLHQKLANQAVTDPLTGAFNRRFMDLGLESVTARAQRRLVVSSILMIDVDHFKEVNDRFGHQQGDKVLQGIVRLARERMRLTDSIFRFGGEEFLLLLDDTNGDGAMVVAEAIRHSIDSEELVSGLKIAVSIGVAEYSAGQSVDDWIKAADRALYAAKAGGRNRIERNLLR